MSNIDFKSLESSAATDGIQKNAVGACIMHDGKVLLLKRSLDEAFLPGLIEFPSGKVEDGESLSHALIREVLEEANLTVALVDKYIGHFDYVSHSGKKARQFNFVVTVDDIAPIKLNHLEHSEYFWLEPVVGDLDHYNISESTLAIIGKLS